jgi:hypothetical protein
MKLVIAFTIAMITTASAQTFSLPPAAVTIPRTVPWTDGKGQAIGTATFDGNRMYLRDLNNKHIATVVTDANGITLFDPSGNTLDHVEGFKR